MNVQFLIYFFIININRSQVMLIKHQKMLLNFYLNNYEIILIYVSLKSEHISTELEVETMNIINYNLYTMLK